MKKKIKRIINSPYFSAGMLTVFAVLTLVGAILHEPRLDETQAWCLVRDNDIGGIYAALQYEGHPPLWYMVLFPFVKAGLPPEVLPFISWAFTFASACLVVKKAPFGNITKLLILLSGGFIYHIAVTSRIYCVILLVLCLLTVLYPKRKEHPLLFGLLTGLLAMSHIIMCGLVGIIGIYMLIDLFRDWRKNSIKKNLLNIGGVLIAGAGVVMLVLPLLYSLSANYYITDEPLTAGVFFERLTECFFCIGRNLVRLRQISSVDRLFGVFASVIIITALVMMRRYPKAVISFCVFSVFFFFATQIIYPLILPSRVNLYVYVLMFIYWAAVSSGEPLSCDFRLNAEKVGDGWVKKLLVRLTEIDKHYHRNITAVICVLCLMSVPSGLIMLFKDYGHRMTAAKAVTEYIRENIDLSDSVIVIDHRCSVYCAEMPGLKMYEPNFNRYITYDQLDLTEEQRFSNYQGPHEELRQYQHIYLLTEKRVFYVEKRSSTQIVTQNVIFETDYQDEYLDYYCHVELSELTPQEIDYLCSDNR